MARGVPVPCCDELLGELTDFSAAARQFDSLFTFLFEALRNESEFSPVYLAPKAVQKYVLEVKRKGYHRRETERRGCFLSK
jgi:hypothetical protein